MFSIRLIVQEYRAKAHYMDRHRRQSSSRPFRACFTGDPRHVSTLSASVFPTYHGQIKAGTYLLSTAYTPTRIIAVLSGEESKEGSNSQ